MFSDFVAHLYQATNRMIGDPNASEILVKQLCINFLAQIPNNSCGSIYLEAIYLVVKKLASSTW